MIENNKLLAKFMGMSQGKPNETRWKNDWFEQLTVNGNVFESGRRHEYLHFDSDWNWLMEVVEKIESLDYGFEIIGNYCKIGNNANIQCSQPTKIQAVYNACITFVKWYNENSAKES